MNSPPALNERFEAYIQTQYPDWLGALQRPESNSEDHDSAALVLGNPRGPDWPPLEVRSDSERMTVQFGSHHAHFEGDEDETLLPAAFALTFGILEERIVSATLYYGPYRYVSDFCHLEELPLVEAASRPRRRPGLLRRLLGRAPELDPGNSTSWRSYGPVHYVFGPPPPGACALAVRSWLGTHDRHTVLT